ncbi:hypothetical protein WSI_00385 [Candidatus Liberibacter asiaticus str. gxpsy]|uniref:Uncharacterized protein n=2 Tax=Liberibacter asiaticus TaxID=34021 RepID=C6XHE1_LIBAP|nr:hypothetical protein CLIBASIA_00480 [Candidatus Liberibacter asiaticus str. psy62]AGH16452.1 hypothetical protein WSI_00385 [Candidatus Liberibacter asiaticus str. gxpsy]BAP25970.1 hypothetical protein CGUJ_00480 [Candidatus Liberibacter asiaticus str. Ishi-1]
MIFSQIEGELFLKTALVVVRERTECPIHRYFKIAVFIKQYTNTAFGKSKCKRGRGK